MAFREMRPYHQGMQSFSNRRKRAYRVQLRSAGEVVWTSPILLCNTETDARFAAVDLYHRSLGREPEVFVELKGIDGVSVELIKGAHA